MTTAETYKALAARAGKLDFHSAIAAEKEWLEDGAQQKWALDGKAFGFDRLPSDVQAAIKKAYTAGDRVGLMKARVDAGAGADKTDSGESSVAPATLLKETGDRATDSLTSQWGALQGATYGLLDVEGGEVAGIRRQPIVLMGARIPAATKAWAKARRLGLSLLTAGYPSVTRALMFGIVPEEESRLSTAYKGLWDGISHDPMYRGVALWLARRGAVVLTSAQSRTRDGAKWFLIMDQTFARQGKLDTWLWPDSR